MEIKSLNQMTIVGGNMKSEVYRRLWKLEILTGKYPAKTSSFKLICLRKDICGLFSIVEKVVFKDVNHSKVFENLKQQYYIIDNLYDEVVKLNRLTKRKILICYEMNSIFKYDIITEENKIIVRIPNCLF